MKKPSDSIDDDMMGDVAPVTDNEETKLVDHPDYETLVKQLTEAEQALAALTEKSVKMEARNLHTLADMENLRRRTERDVSDAHKFAVRRLLEDLVPVLDSLEQSLVVAIQDNELVDQMRNGMALTLQMLQKVLEKFGVKEIDPLHQPFDPAWHEVMMAQTDAEFAANTVIKVLQKGYQLHDRVVRPARVVVAKA